MKTDFVVTNARVWEDDASEYPVKHIYVDGNTGTIKRVEFAQNSEKPEEGKGLTIVDAAGGLVTPTYAEPHLHLDAVLLGREYANKSGTLVEGIANWANAKKEVTVDSLLLRASKALEWMVACGTTRIRTHADTGCPIGVEALLSLKKTVAQQQLATIQIVGFPQDGILTSQLNRKHFDWACTLGLDAIGAIPHYERTHEEATESLRIAFDAAEKYGCMVDVHCDETDDPHSRHIETVCQLTEDRGMGGKVVAGHCTAMHSYNGPAADKVLGAIKRSQVQVVTNPLDSIVLQGRFDDYPKRRGLTRVPELLQAGNKVGLGHDSIVDPWYPLGMGNLLDAAHMLVHACHLTGQDEMRRVFQMMVSDNHVPFGGAPKIREGESAEFLVHSLNDPLDIIRTRRVPSYVVRNGIIVAVNYHGKAAVLDQEIDIGNFGAL
eukprot:CAMPEP_0184481740 /NCGR_PEP_ID=MMETSP0113_2-20130426/3306_1 /TAXON_ID=91329 /ORGANISM="Norrisiella sphaerica, Strain BC52" /LENGTH=434 /DNA_ID=CAMNT_0026861051 /DNA_START=317 /DNA_END=1621 /DNA_ORIENTATION=+